MIITFYSYKGGVGRTQLLANMAAYYCYNLKKRVLLIDWDLDAPGLHNYFGINPNSIGKGLMDIFFEYIAYMRQNNYVTEETISKHHLFPNDSHILKPVDDTDSCIHLLAAGNYDNEYFKKINSFDWNEFYDDYDGKIFIELLKDHLKKQNYDYILIDSRTGVNDYSGICNIQIPDMNVLVLAPTNPNFEGVLRMATNIISSPYTQKYRRNTIILPILSRVDGSSDFYEEFKERFFTDFDFLVRKLTHLVQFKNKTDEFYRNTRLMYAYKVAAGENLLFDKIQTIKKIELTEKYTYIADLIEDINNIIFLNRKESGKILNPLLETNALKQLAQKQYDNRQFELAIANYEQVLQRDESDHSTMFSLAEIYKELGRPYDAIDLYSKSIDVIFRYSPEDKAMLAQTYNRIGTIYQSLGEDEKALKFLNIGN